MDRKKIDSYEETHRKLVEAMQEACVRDDFDDYPDPDIDISFIYEDIDDDAEAENMPPETRKKRFSFTSRFNKVAAILVVLLLTGNILLLATNSNESYGHKGLLHRLSETMTGVVTDNDNPVGEDEVVDYYNAYTMNDIISISKQFPDLYIPTYMAKGYELEEFVIRTYESSDYTVLYNYINGNEVLNINLSYCSDSNYKIYHSDPVETIRLEDRIIYVRYDVADETYTIEIVYEKCVAEIDGLNNKEEMIKIATGMKKHT